MIKCPSCNSKINKDSFFYCPRQPVNENVLFSDIESAKNSAIGVIDMRFCTSCGLAFNAAFKLDDVDYGDDYQYCEPPTPTFEKFISELCDLLIENYDVTNSSIVEFGCGQGEFLSKLCLRGNNEGRGYDTAYAGPLISDLPAMKFYKRFFDPKIDGSSSSFSSARQVLEHIQDPNGLVTDMIKSIKPTGKVYLEVPNLDWIIENTVIWDFYFEHCSYFNVNTLSSLISQNGGEVVGSELLFNDQYIGVIGRNISNDHKKIKSEGIIQKLEEDINAFVERAKTKRNAIERVCESLSSRGPWCIWGGAAKGVTFVNLFSDFISEDCAVIDINPIRQNKYVPVVGLPILGPEKLLNLKPHTAVVMNSNYIEEIKTEISNQGLDCDVIGVDNIPF